jgi:branched-chain amino acid transport system ATP-binding protein
MSAPLLEVRALRKRFGALVVTDALDLEVAAGEIHALIGPNGAGKTTLVAQLAGELHPDGGSIRFAGEDITRRPMHARARRGLVRSWQVTRLFRSLTVGQHLEFAASAAGVSASPELLAQSGLAGREHADIEQLSHGEQRALEVALALAARPRLLLLDEPMAGLGAQESQAMAQRITGLRGTCAVLLIEHDVEAVFRLADRVSVLVGGALLASGTPAQVRSDPRVLAAYLGESEGAA